MSPFATGFTCFLGLLLLTLPRKRASIPLLMGASYMTLGQAIAIEGSNFTVLRLLIALSAVRVVVRREWIPKLITLDKLVVLWGVAVMWASFFHKVPDGSAFVSYAGLVYNGLGMYFLLRVFIRNAHEAYASVAFMSVLLLPVALAMILEQVTGRNLFAILGGVPDLSEVRNGRIRSQGPFAHSILAGTVGGSTLPLLASLWAKQRYKCIIGACACLVMVATSASSGPLMTSLFAAGALGLWKFRDYVPAIRRTTIAVIIVLHFVMKAPVWYLLSRIDLTGSSTAWHRAELIDTTIRHFREWWFAGTDITRHWMPTGVAWSDQHTDITNHYIQMGVVGGLPLMLSFMAIVFVAFKITGELAANPQVPEQGFLVWSWGAALFAHAMSFISVSYFDQSVIFFWLTVAALGSLKASSADNIVEEESVLSGLQEDASGAAGDPDCA